MGEGMRFIANHAAVSFVVMAMAAGMFVMGCFGPLIAIYVREWLHAQSGVFGIVSAMVGTGMLFGIPLVRRVSGDVSNSTLVLSGLAGIGLGALLLGALPWVGMSMLACFTLGFAFAGVIVPAQTLMQQETPAAMMGRISSTTMSVVFFAQLIGLVLSGVLAQMFGVRAVFFLCAVLAWVLTGAGKLLLSTDRHATARRLGCASASSSSIQARASCGVRHAASACNASHRGCSSFSSRGRVKSSRARRFAWRYGEKTPTSTSSAV